jgi:orotidine-5'-phosphate decarboxylase
MTRHELHQLILKKQSYLCVGLDTDLDKIPKSLLSAKDPVFEFNKLIIDATASYCVAYKPNLAFYEALGAKGWESLQRTIEYIPQDQFIIADAKRGDIGNTSGLYAKAFFEKLFCDAVTVAPYMGEDSVKPFIEYPGKWVIVLAHTSNAGSADFQTLRLQNGKTVYEEVISKAMTWGTPDQLMFVFGATQAEKIKSIRALAPDHFFLVPGVGAQGGDLAALSRDGMNKQVGLLVNASRSILYASNTPDFAAAAAREAERLQKEMQTLLATYQPLVSHQI